MKRLACAAVLSMGAFAGCAGTAPFVIDPSTYPPASADPSHLVFGVHGHSSAVNLENPDLAGMLVNAGGIRESVLLSSDFCREACDVVVNVACSPDFGSGPARVTAKSAVDGRELFSATEKGDCEPAAAALGTRLKQAFAPGTALYQTLMTEKRSRFGLAPASSSEAAESPKPDAEKPWWERPASTGR